MVLRRFEGLGAEGLGFMEHMGIRVKAWDLRLLYAPFTCHAFSGSSMVWAQDKAFESDSCWSCNPGRKG